MITLSQVNVTSNLNEALLSRCENLMCKGVHDHEAASFHFSSGGSRNRAKLAIAAGLALHLDFDDTIAIASCIELLHNASLVHDDIQDRDENRRGRIATWKRFGIEHAITAGDLMIAQAYNSIANLSQTDALPSAINMVTDAVNTTINGQTRDINVLNSVDVKQYESIAAQKAGPLFALSLALPLLLSNHHSYINKATKALNRFAVAYQILDDVDDWQEDRLKLSQLNIVNLLAKQSSINEALFIATERSTYLLRKCLNELQDLPSDCAAAHQKIAKSFLNKCQSNSNE